MQTFTVAYCRYNPDGAYFGHKLKRFDAETFEQAEQAFHEWANSLCGKGKWEYQIYQSLTAPRLYDNAKRVRL